MTICKYMRIEMIGNKHEIEEDTGIVYSEYNGK